MNASVVVIDSNYQFVSVVPFDKAMKLIVKGKAVIHTYEENVQIWRDYFLPKIIKLVRSITDLYNRVLPWTKANVHARDNYTCQYCGATSGRMTIDHIHPQSKGGKNTYQNTVTSCISCNNKKGDKSLEESGLKLKKKPTTVTLYDLFARKMKGMNLSYKDLW